MAEPISIKAADLAETAVELHEKLDNAEKNKCTGMLTVQDSYKPYYGSFFQNQ